MLDVRNPFSGDVIDRVPLADERELDRVAGAAHGAFASYLREPAFRRADLLQRIASLVESRKTSSPRRSWPRRASRSRSPRRRSIGAAWTFCPPPTKRDNSTASRSPPTLFPVGAGSLAIARRFPVGVVYGITPFNFPLNLVAHKVAPAMACGYTIVIKPSPSAPLSALMLAVCDLARSVLPTEVFHVVIVAIELTTHLINDQPHLASFPSPAASRSAG